MAQDCYDLFKDTYNRAIIDGLATAVATAAAQSAMDACLRQQGVQTPAVNPVVSVPAAGVQDPGPSNGDSANRGSNLGGLRNNKKGQD